LVLGAADLTGKWDGEEGVGRGVRERGTRGGQTLGADTRRERADARTERRTTYQFFYHNFRLFRSRDSAATSDLLPPSQNICTF
jgi:hypothetical protein